MSLRGTLQGSILSRGVASGAGVDIPAPEGTAAPVIGSFTVADNPATEGVATTFNWSLSGGTPTSQVLNPGDGSANYTVSPGTTSQAHTFDFADAGGYDATLTVSNAGGSDSESVLDIVVEAPSSVAFKNWGTLTSFTFTMKNESGASKDNAPVRYFRTLHKGWVPSGSRLQLRDPSSNIVADTDWQYSQRRFYDDGSLASFVIYCYGPTGWTDGTNRQWTVERVTGSHPSESDFVAVSILSGVTDPEVVAESCTRLGPDSAPTDQAAHSSATLTFNLQDALALARTQKLVAGPIVTSYYTWRWMQTTAPADDAYIWVKCWVDIWRQPSSSTVRHVAIEPQINNGSVKKEGRAMAFKLKVADGASTIIDYTHSQSLTSANMSTSTDAINVGLGTMTMPVYAGTACYVASGTPPSAITVGKLYEGRWLNNAAGGGDQFANQPQGFNFLGVWGKEGSGGGQVNLTDTGGSWTLETWVRSVHYQPVMLFDRDGFELWAVGGARIVPNLTRAEKLSGMQCGTYHNVDLDDGTVFGAFEDRPFHPGGQAYHRLDRDQAGGVFYGGHNIGELGTWTWDALIDMDTFLHHKVLRRAAAEVVGVHRCGMYEDTTDGGGVEYMTPVVINNGPNKAGAQYSGLGPSRPTANRKSGYGSYKFIFIGNNSADSANLDGNVGSQARGGLDGTHASQAASRAFELYPCWMYREAALMQWMDVVCDTQGLYPGPGTLSDIHKLSSLHKTLGSTTYYHITATGMNARFAKRTFIGATELLRTALYHADDHPLGPYITDIATDNLDFLAAFYNDGTKMGDVAKIVGPTFSLEGDSGSTGVAVDWVTGNAVSSGNQQYWQMLRLAASTLRLMKATGIESTEVLSWYTAQSRLIWHDPNSGDPPQMHIGHHLAGVSTQLFDNSQLSAAVNSGDQQLLGHFRDAAAQGTDGRLLAVDGQYTSHVLKNDGSTFQVTMPSASFAYQMVSRMAPSDGDMVRFMASGSVTVPTGITSNQWYWLYNRSGTPGFNAVMSFGLSSTDPAITTTPVTWTTASDKTITPGYLAIIYKQPGTFTGGLWNYDTYNAAYVGNSIEPVTTALMLFGTESGAGGANDNWEQVKADLLSGQTRKWADRASFIEATAITKYMTS